MSNSNYLTLLSSIGLHIGSSTSLSNADVYTYQYITGSRNNFYIFNIPTSIFLLKRALVFVEKLASFNPYNTLCVSHSDINTSDLLLALYSNFHYNTGQPVITSKWINGLFTNWTQIVFGMVRPLFAKKRERFEYGFQIILAKMIFILMKRALRMDELEFYKKYSIMARFWKFLLLFQFFIHLKKLPSSFLYISKVSINYPIYECGIVKIPVIALVDSGTSLQGITYPIPGNSNSILVTSLMLNLFANSILRGKYEFYVTHKLTV